MTIKAVLFDLDGTLVDSNGWHVQAWDEAFRAHGYILSHAAIAAQIGKGGDQLVPALAPDAPDDVRGALSRHHGTAFQQRYLHRVVPFPDARALIERVHGEGKTVVLASSAKRAELEHYVGLLGIADLVDASTTIEDVASSKPAPDIFAKALEKAGAAADQTRAIGDTPYDVDAAAAVGIKTLAVLSGGFPAARLERAEAVYRDVSDLLAGYADSPLGR